jgi:hypothetical protein
MSIEQVIGMFQNWPFLLFALVLWNTERQARISAEKREREILRDMAQMKPETPE